MQEELLRIFSDYLEDVEYLNQEQKVMFMQLCMESKKLITFCYDCFLCMNGGKEKAEIEEKQWYFYMDSQCHMDLEAEKIVLNSEDMRELLGKIIDIFEPVYPLGTVVELKEDFTRSLKLQSPDMKVKAVIVERFAATKDKQTYFPYVGVIYPVGTLGYGRFLHFTSALVDSVVQDGYRDEMEDAYVLLMKKELLLDHDAVSFGFLQREQAEGYREELGVGKNGEEGD